MAWDTPWNLLLRARHGAYNEDKAVLGSLLTPQLMEDQRLGAGSIGSQGRNWFKIYKFRLSKNNNTYEQRAGGRPIHGKAICPQSFVRFFKIVLQCKSRPRYWGLVSLAQWRGRRCGIRGGKAEAGLVGIGSIVACGVFSSLTALPHCQPLK